jgi:acyl carrier protein
MTPDQVHTLIAEVLGIDVNRVLDELAYGDLPEWSSLHHVNLMLALEDRLGVEIGPDQMVELTSVSAIETFAAEHGSGSNGSHQSELPSATD